MKIFLFRDFDGKGKASDCFSKLIISFLPDIFKAFQNELIYQTKQQWSISAI